MEKKEENRWVEVNTKGPGYPRFCLRTEEKIFCFHGRQSLKSKPRKIFCRSVSYANMDWFNCHQVNPCGIYFGPCRWSESG